MMRFGFAVKVLGNGGLPSHDSRRWQSSPHLSVSITMLYNIFKYLHKNQIRMYRMSSDFAPYATHPEMPQFHNQINECRAELRDIGKKAKELDIRLSLHPSQFVVLNAIDDSIAQKAAADLLSQSELLDAMELDNEAVVVTHVGGIYGDKDISIGRFIERWHRLPEPARRRVVVENDERLFSVRDTMQIHESTGARLIFDYQHHMLNPGNQELNSALEQCLKSWPEGQKPKIHFSSSRTEMRILEKRNPLTKKKERAYQPPLISQHADYINPLEYIMFMKQLPNKTFDVMIEAKSKDLALLSLRKFLIEQSLEEFSDL